MRKRVWLGLAVLFCILLTASVWRALTQPDPVYSGKRLSLWLKEVPKPGAFERGFNDLIQEQGPTVLPHLVRALRTRDSPIRRPYLWVKGRAPAFIANRMPDWIEPQLVREGAANWLAAMGPSAEDAAPGLRQAATGDRSERVRQAAIYALVRIGIDSKGTKLLVNSLHDPSPLVRQAAAGGLEICTPGAPEVIPSLIGGLNDLDAVVREVCAATLGKYGPRAVTAVGPLQKLATSDDQAADYALQALKQIEPTAVRGNRK